MRFHAGFIRWAKIHKYSAVLTSFNAEKFIANAINSILSQDVPPSELIIVDDCSSDSSFQLASEFQSNSNLVKVFRNSSNEGVSFSRNFAVQNALEDIIIFFDDDDISFTHRAKVHLDQFVMGADVSFVSSSKKYLNGHTVQNLSRDFLGKLDPKDCAKNQLLGSSAILATPASCMAIKRKSFLKVSGFDERLIRLEDTDISIRLSIENAVFSFSSSVCVKRFDFGKSISPFEGISQKVILDRYRSYLSAADYKDARFKIEVRDLYFNRKYFMLIFRIFQEITSNPLQIKYLLIGWKRVKHDWSKK